MTNTTTPQQIAALNDQFRKQGPHGVVAGRDGYASLCGRSSAPFPTLLLS